MKTLYFAVLLVLVGVLDGSNVFAGTLVIHDSQGFIPSGDVDRLRQDQGQWPFDAHILVENASSLNVLEDHAHNAINGPNVVAIGLDPVHHKTVVRFGIGTGVKQGDYDSISAAGNAHFRGHEIADGFEAILFRAKASAEAKVAMSTSNAPVTVEVKSGIGFGTGLFITLLVVGFAGLAIFLYRRAKRNQEAYQRALDENRLETAELRSRNVEEQTWAEGVRRSIPASTNYSAPAPIAPVPYAAPPLAPVAYPASPTTVVVNQSGGTGGGSGDFTTGLLMGELMADRRQPEVIREVEVERPSHHRSRSVEEDYSDKSSRASDDGGGASSSWDSGNSSWSSDSTPSSDSGGSSSNWDSGSSSSYDGGDIGGGGFDGGGGGSDW